MFDAEDGAGETAISFTNQFFDAAIARLDAVFGKGYAKENPALVQAYMTSCASNLAAFMQSALALTQSGLLDEIEDEAPPPRKR